MWGRLYRRWGSGGRGSEHSPARWAGLLLLAACCTACDVYENRLLDPVRVHVDASAADASQSVAPADASPGPDSRCNDGKVTGDEKCDTAIAADQPGACPTSCTPIDACTSRTLQGTGCATECAPVPVTMVGAKDGCCPSEGNATNDVDCAPKCGNGVLESGETCDPQSSCAPCSSDNACSVSIASGSAETCNLHCQTTTITQCRDGDKCCPSGCTRNNDQDCSASCGNGAIDSGETCENGSSNPCPSSCNDMKPCTTDAMVGSAGNCNVTCTNVAITQTVNGDGCCLSGANANSDNDCKPQCGNRTVESGEQCDDGNQVAGDGCLNCQTETAQQICLAKLNASTPCAQCTCMKCNSQVLACQGYSDANDAMLCAAMVECARRTGCRDPDCLCGDANTLSCGAGNGNGPCKDEVFAAGKSNSPLQLQSRVSDTDYPLGRANAEGDCADRNCATECAM